MTPQVIYLHGMGGSPADWRLVKTLIPGEAINLPVAPSFRDAVRALIGDLEKIEAPLILCGYSLGGRLAVHLAAELGSQVYGLVLLSTGLGFPSTAEREERKRMDEAWAALAERNPRQFWEDWYGQALFSTFHGLPQPLKTDWLKDRLALDSARLRSQLVSMGPSGHDFLLPELLVLQHIELAMIYLAGEKDQKYSALANELAKQNFETRLIPGVGHILPLEAPDAVANALKEMLARFE